MHSSNWVISSTGSTRSSTSSRRAAIRGGLARGSRPADAGARCCGRPPRRARSRTRASRRAGRRREGQQLVVGVVPLAGSRSTAGRCRDAGDARLAEAQVLPGVTVLGHRQPRQAGLPPSKRSVFALDPLGQRSSRSAGAAATGRRLGAPRPGVGAGPVGVGRRAQAPRAGGQPQQPQSGRPAAVRGTSAGRGRDRCRRARRTRKPHRCCGSPAWSTPTYGVQPSSWSNRRASCSSRASRVRRAGRAWRPGDRSAGAPTGAVAGGRRSGDRTGDADVGSGSGRRGPGAPAGRASGADWTAPMSHGAPMSRSWPRASRARIAVPVDVAASSCPAGNGSGSTPRHDPLGIRALHRAAVVAASARSRAGRPRAARAAGRRRRRRSRARARRSPRWRSCSRATRES